MNTRFFSTAVLLLVLATSSFGCKHKRVPDPKTLMNTKTVVNAKPAMKPPEYEPLSVAMTKDTKLQPHVKMLAEAEGEAVQVQIQNFTDKPIGVESINFGIIREGEGKRVHPFDPSVHTTTFPKIGLNPGAIASGTLTFSGLGNLAGQRLVFNHSQTRPSLAYITGPGATPIAVPVKKVEGKKPAKKK